MEQKKPNETKKRIFFTKNEPKSKKIKNIKEEKCHFCLSSFDSRVKYNIHLQSVHMKDAGVHLVDFRLNNKKFIKSCENSNTNKNFKKSEIKFGS